ncbi:MFS general substrate transporter [Pyrrhoderma noxium]|uniref:MFS general substrate transporter n=1 Tax=Pyrrhoderma noxium TaxID=2282107 RepID=A0A286UJT0_9AGAM|nr:MFS general substrate transporter [Pyrrhoderma noxium]
MSVEMKVRESGSTTPKSQEKDQAILSDSIPVLEDQKSELPTIDEKKLLRKIDWVLIPWLSFLYLVAFLDRSSIGNAKLYNMEADLHITDTQYLICLSIFFIPYALLDVPSNIFLKRLRPSIWLSSIMFLWGIMMTVQGLVHNFGGLFAMRWMLGTFEAGLFPGVNYYLSCWYKRSEFGLRAALFFSAATVSGAFGGLLAAAISKMDGIGGKPAWAWIFILEGLASVIVGFISFFVIQDFPDTARFLTDEERVVVIARLQNDGMFSAGGEVARWKYIWDSIIDWKTWVGMILYTGANGPLYGFALFLPSIINQLGFQATPANLLTVPVYVVACIFTCAIGFMADRLGRRGYFTIGCFSLGIAAYLILIFSRSAALSYFAVYMAACGIYPLIPNIIAWCANNVEGTYKRSVSLGWVIGFGNINGAATSNAYRARDAPHYVLGHGIVILYIGMGFIAANIMLFFLRRENACRARGERDETIIGVNDDKPGLNLKNGMYASVEEARADKGDKWSGYKYTL